MQLFNDLIMKNEQQKQYMLQVAERHHKDFQDCQIAIILRLD